MAQQTSISWTDCVWNPIAGCSPASAGCQFCYAKGMASRLVCMGQAAKYGGLTRKVDGKVFWTGEVRFVESDLLKPLLWRKPRMVFVDSMSDWCHARVSDAWRDQMLAIAALTPQHSYQALTKRAAIMRNYLNDPSVPARVEAAMRKLVAKKGIKAPVFSWPLANWWTGVSIENQQVADERLPLLSASCSAIRFASCEPLLGPVKLGKFASKLDWVIVGGESGRSARPFEVEWMENLRRECQKQGTAFFSKQLGANPFHHGVQLLILEPSKKDPSKLIKSGHAGDLDAWPKSLAHLTVREFPVSQLSYEVA
jgi:protein gp37